MNVFLHSNCTSPEQECILLQPDVGVDDEKETTATTQQAAVCEEVARPTKKRQQQKTTAWTTNQSKQLDRGRSTMKSLLSEERNVLSHALLFSCFTCVCLLSIVAFFLSCTQFSEAGTNGDGSDWDVPDASTTVPEQERASSSRFSLTKGIACTTLFLVAQLLRTVFCFFDCLAGEIIGRLSW